MDDREIRRLFAEIESLKRKISQLESNRNQFLYAGKASIDAIWGRIISSTPISANQWEYSIYIQTRGGATLSGLQNSTAVMTGYNVAEELSNTGYVNDSVTGIKPVPNGALIRCYESTKDDEVVLLFRERNEPEC